MGISLDGLASGLDSTSLIAKMMQLEAQPQAQLQATQAQTNSAISDFRMLNGKLAALATAATSAAAPGAIDKFTAVSSDPSITVTPKAGATAADLTVSVGQLASRQVVVSAAMAAWPTTPTVLTFVRPDGTTTEVRPASTSMSDVAGAINQAGLGITATSVASGTDATGAPLYRLQLTSDATGAAAAFRVYRGDAASVTAGTATDLSTEAGAAVVRTAADASLTLWAGTPAAQTVTSSSNTFTDLLPGMDVTVSAVTAAPASIGLKPDNAATTKAASAFLDGIRSALNTIVAGAATTKSTDADGKPITVVGSFTSDSNIRALTDALTGAVQSPVNGASVAPYGISFSKDGDLEFDADRFQAALAANPAQVQAAFATIASRVADVANRYSDSTQGLLTQEIAGKQSLSDDLQKQIDDWTDRLAQREATLKRTYAELEVTMSSMKSNSAYLQSQLAGLPSWTPSSK